MLPYWRELPALLPIIVLMIVGITVVDILIEIRWRPSPKQRAIDRHAKHLGTALRSRYGLQTQYTPVQVKQALQDAGLSSSYDCYGLAMYCDRTDFANYHDTRGESCDYDTMRQEICDYLSFPDTTFNAADVLEFGDRDRHHNSSHSHEFGHDLSGHHNHNAGGFHSHSHDAGGNSGNGGGGHH